MRWTDRKGRRGSIITILVVGFGLIVSPSAKADFFAIYGGPSYDAVTGNGYLGAGTPIDPPGFAGNGFAIVNAAKYQAGTFVSETAVRWDISGTVTELSKLSTDSTGVSAVFAMNSSGAAVGGAAKIIGGNYVGERPVRWDAAGNVTELATLGSDGRAYAINNQGIAVGYAEGNGSDAQPLRWDLSGNVTQLNLPSNTSGSAYGINDSGTAVGDHDDIFSAVRWDASGAITELGAIGTWDFGFGYSRATAINNAGIAIGFVQKNDAGYRAARWDVSGVGIELGNLGTSANGSTDLDASAINSAGTAVGYAQKWEAGINKGLRAVRWDAAGPAAIELGNLGTTNNGVTVSKASALNDAGIAVGYANIYDNLGNLVGTRAVEWGLDGKAIDLNTLIDPGSGWILTSAFSVSSDNWVAGVGRFDPDGPGGLASYSRSFLIQIPEPMCVTLIFGASPLLVRRLRRVRSHYIRNSARVI